MLNQKKKLSINLTFYLRKQLARFRCSSHKLCIVKWPSEKLLFSLQQSWKWNILKITNISNYLFNCEQNATKYIKKKEITFQYIFLQHCIIWQLCISSLAYMHISYYGSWAFMYKIICIVLFCLEIYTGYVN